LRYALQRVNTAVYNRRALAGHLHGAVAVSLLGLAFIACSRADGGSLATDGMDRTKQSLTWSGRSTNGVSVHLRADQSSLVATQPVQFEIRIDDRAVTHPVTADLLAPQMPAHGITRYKAVAIGPGVFTLRFEIPMEGLWELYVNLDDGADAAAFTFDVAAPITTTASQHAAHGPVSTHVPQ
jgi:hypothetical protein